jgi:hypothetical protein
MKSSRNKTIDFPITEADKYLTNCVYVDKVSSINLDSIVIGDAYEAI